MTLDTIFYVQVGTVLTFVGTLFGLYRLLVNAKDATIELLTQRVADLESRLTASQATHPDALAKALSDRVKQLESELERLLTDKEAHTGRIADVEVELSRIRELAEEYFCPHCQSPLMSRESRTVYFEHDGRDVDVDHLEEAFECGFVLVDGREMEPCPNKSA